MNERALKFTPLPRMADCITETTGDLFELPGVKCIAHCISADCEMGAGFAKRVAARYGGASFRQRAAARSPRIGEAVPVLAEGGVLVYNLVTKARYFEKPTLHALGEALVSMREYARTAGIRRITMPRIGCGLDRLEWSDVRALLDKTYRGSGIEIVVVELVAKSARATTSTSSTTTTAPTEARAFEKRKLSELLEEVETRKRVRSALSELLEETETRRLARGALTRSTTDLAPDDE